MRYTLVFLAACSSSGASGTTELTYLAREQVEINTNLSPQGIDLVSDTVGQGGDFACDAAGGVRDDAAGSTYSRLADVGPVASVEDISPPPADSYVVVESVPLAMGEGYFVRAADGCPARLRVDGIHPVSFGDAVDVTYERADCAQITIQSTLNVTGPTCPPGQTHSGGGDVADVSYGDWPLMQASLGTGGVVLRVPRGRRVSLTAHGKSISWSGDCGGGSCSLVADADKVVNISETVMWSCFPGA